MKNKVIIVYLWVVIVGTVATTFEIYSQAPAEWSSLIPLESTREDVERILGSPLKQFDTFGMYDTKAGKYMV